MLDPAQEEFLRERIREVNRVARRLGANLSEDQIQRIAFFAERNGLRGPRLREWLANEWVNMDWGEDIDFYGDDNLAAGGTEQSDVQARLAETAARYMIPLGDLDDEDNVWVRRVLESDDPSGELDLIEDQMKRMAEMNFPTIASYLKQGMTPQQFFAPYVNVASSLLERPVDFVGGDRKYLEAFASTEGDKGLRPMTWSEARRWVKSQDEWQTTRNAHEEYSDMVHKVAEMFGEAV